MLIRLLIFLVASMILTISSGCLFSENKIVYAGFAKEEPETNGAIQIATNKKVPVTVGGVASTMDLGGMYVIRGADLKLLIRKANENSH
jgi:hypothetical protein